MDFKGFLNALNEEELLLEGKVFTQEQLDPVIIQKPQKGAKGQPPPPPKGGGQTNVEIHNVEEPEPTEGEEGEGEGQKQKGKQPKGKKGEKKPGEGEPGEGEGEEGEKKDAGAKPADGSGKEEPGEAKKTGEVSISRKEAGKGEPEGKQSAPGKRRTSLDSHEVLNKSNTNGAREMAEKIYKQAAEKRAKKGSKKRGTEEGGFIEKLGGIYEAKVDWVNELREKITTFQSDTARSMDRWMKLHGQKFKEGAGKVKSKSYSQWLRDPRSHAGMGSKDQMIFRGPYVKSPVAEAVLIVALDTSGSIGSDVLEKVFGEMDSIASSFQRGITTGGRKLEGKVYFMEWDTAVHQVERYKTGAWKNAKIKGRGGTDIQSVYKYINDHTRYNPDEEATIGLINLMKKPTETGMDDDDVALPYDPDEELPVAAPFLIVATDGYFGQVSDSTLGDVYKDNKESIVYLIIDGTDEYCHPKNVIKYDEVRV